MKRKQKKEAGELAGPTQAGPPAAADPAAKELARRRAAFDHSVGLTASVYRHLLEPVVGEKSGLCESSGRHVADLLDRFNARDPVEEMLIGQMVQTHLRLTYLNSYAHQPKGLAWAKLMHEAADRAANTFRRQMLALAEYRNPGRPRSVTTIGQANVAQQQVVQNGPAPREQRNATNEQGSADNGQAALPALPGGAGLPAGECPPAAAVAAQHGATDGGRQGAGTAERAAAR